VKREIVKAAELVVQVTRMICRHKSILNNQTLASFDIKPETPIASIVKRMRRTQARKAAQTASNF
jgi:hypothetical protein